PAVDGPAKLQPLVIGHAGKPLDDCLQARFEVERRRARLSCARFEAGQIDYLIDEVENRPSRLADLPGLALLLRRKLESHPVRHTDDDFDELPDLKAERL